MLKTIAASVAASRASVKTGATKNESHDTLKPCQCGSAKLWLPVGHRDVATSYRCSNCMPSPSVSLVAKEIDLDLANAPVFEITFNAGEPACFRCGGSLVTLSQNGYCCSTCLAQVHSSVSDRFWGAA